MSQKKGKPVRLYIREEDEPVLAEFGRLTGLSDTSIMTMLLSAAFRAVKDANYRLPLPLSFKAFDADLAANPREMKPTTPIRR
jgi:hypothetical protein